MVIVRIRGGIGNQLFMYAAAKRLAMVNNTELVVDNVSGFSRDFSYERNYQLHNFNIDARFASSSERMEPFGRLRRMLRKKYNLNKQFSERNYLVQDGPQFDPRFLTYKTSRDVYLEGYWQSERYFIDIENVIRQDLTIRAPKDNHNLAMSEKIQMCNSVALHVRFFDLPDEKNVNNAESSYYESAIHKLHTFIGDDVHFFLFSDHPDLAISKLNIPDEKLTVVDINRGDEFAYADIWLMSQCQHFIIANSTFSWWGAWLGAHTDKIVIAPEFVMTEGKMSWGFDGLIPESWLTC